MKSITKRLIALILAICSVIGFAMPSVYATGNAGTGTDGGSNSNQNTLKSVTYDLAGAYGTIGSVFIFAGGLVRSEAQPLQDAYAAGTSNWKLEAGTVKQVKTYTNYIRMDTGVDKAGSETYFAIRIKSPGTGIYKLNYAYTQTNLASNDEMDYGSVYIIPAAETSYDKKTIVDALKGQAPILEVSYDHNTAGVTSSKEATALSKAYAFEADKEYIVVFGGKEKDAVATGTNALMYARAFTLEEQPADTEIEPNEPNKPNEPETPAFTEGVYDFFAGSAYGGNLAESKDTIAQKYDAGLLNWKYEASHSSLVLSKTTYNIKIKSMYATSAKDWWLAFRIKAPAQDGAYSIQMTHGAKGDGATAGSIFVIPGDTATKDITKVMTRTGAVMTTDWFYGQKASDVTSGRESTTGSVNLRAGKEYIVIFMPTEKCGLDTSNNGSFAMGQLSVTRTGNFVENEGGDKKDDGSILYDFFDWDHPGDYLNHNSRTEEELKKKIITNEIAKKYANGELNWCYQSSNGYAFFNAGTPYLNVTVGETNYYCLKIKSPGTGTYEITYNHYAMANAKAGLRGSIYIVPADISTDYTTIKAAADVKEAIITTSYYANKTTLQKAVGTYPFFQEGKEYYICFTVEDNDASKNSSLQCYPVSLSMKRTGDYVEPEKVLSSGGTIAKNVVTEFRVGTQMTVTLDGHDYLVLCVYGGTMMIYDLDEWRLVDEVDISMTTDTPRTICVDQAGNWWITGASQSLYCYNPYTREGFDTGKVTSGGNNFEMVCGEDGYLYFGAYASTGLYLFRYDPVDKTYTSWRPELWAKYPGAVKQKGDYIYTAVSGGERYEIWKVSKYDGTIADRIDISHMMADERYVTYMSWLGDEYLAAVTPKGWTIVDINTMEMLSQEEVGLRGILNRVTSEDVIDGKVYFVSTVEGLCYFDVETKTFGAVGGELINFKTGLRSNCHPVGIEDSRLEEKSMISFGGMSADGLNLQVINLETKSSVTLIGLVEPGLGEGMNAHTIFKGAPGSNEIIYGPMYPDYPARVFNIQTGELAREFMTNGQNDSYCYYQGKMYFGNYNGAILTRMDDGQATKLFILNDENFNQSRIHSICGADNKLFVSTIPDNYNYGGVIAWYDLETELTYVVTGPNPEDVYYAKCSQIMTATNKWYNAATGELVEDMSKEWDKDQDGDGVYQYFKGPIPMQSINKVTYSDGLLYGLSTLRAGTGNADTPNATAQVFIYDVENMKMLEVIDLADYIPGLPNRIRYITSLDADPDISNKVWGVVSETLFSLTYDKDTGKVDINVELSYDKATISQTESICKDIAFDGDYMYVLFGAKGGLRKINRYNVSDNVLVMGNFQSVNQVPSCFVLGDDGDIYYVSASSPHIYVLNVDITEEDLAEAQTVQDTIDQLPAEITLADREIVFAAREAWDAMRPANQPFVNNYSKLTDAETALLQLRIDDLGEITIEDEEELISIRNTYTRLERPQRMKIDLMKVSKAESVMSILRGQRTSALIDALGEITLAKAQQIRDARASFMALTRYERTLVANIEILNTAEATLNRLLVRENEINTVVQRIDEIGFVFFGPAKILEAREAYDALDDEAKVQVENYNTLVTAEVTLIVEYVLAVVIVAFGVVCAIPATRNKIFKKKAKETKE